jgi:hypothetical protein
LFIGAIVFVENGLIVGVLGRVFCIDGLNLAPIGLSGMFSLEGLLRTLMEIVFLQV